MVRCVVVLMLLVPAAALAAEKKTKKAYLGVMIRLDRDAGGIVIDAVLPDSPALKAGLKASDMLVRIDGAKPPDLRTAVDLIRSLKPGKKTRFEVLREGKRKEIVVTPGELD